MLRLIRVVVVFLSLTWILPNTALPQFSCSTTSCSVPATGSRITYSCRGSGGTYACCSFDCATSCYGWCSSGAWGCCWYNTCDQQFETYTYYCF
jgi:hypothetical protein